MRGPYGNLDHIEGIRKRRREIGQAAAKLLGYEYINKEQVLEDIRSEGGNGARGPKISMSTARACGKSTTGRFAVSLRWSSVTCCIMH